MKTPTTTRLNLLGEPISRPKIGQLYFSISPSLLWVEATTWTDNGVDRLNYVAGNVFFICEKAEKAIPAARIAFGIDTEPAPATPPAAEGKESFEKNQMYITQQPILLEDLPFHSEKIADKIKELIEDYYKSLYSNKTN